MASSSAIRSIFRSCSARPSAFRLASEVKASRSPFCFASNKPLLFHNQVPCGAELLCGNDVAIPYCNCFRTNDFDALHL